MAVAVAAPSIEASKQSHFPPCTRFSFDFPINFGMQAKYNWFLLFFATLRLPSKSPREMKTRRSRSVAKVENSDITTLHNLNYL